MSINTADALVEFVEKVNSEIARGSTKNPQIKKIVKDAFTCRPYYLFCIFLEMTT
jgi:hypothetical protein